MNRAHGLKLGYLAVAIILWLVAATPRAQAEVRPLLFDCGPAESPIMSGYQRLAPDDMYTEARKYGWEGAKPEGVVFGPPKAPDTRALAWEPAYVAENSNDLNRDGVVSKQDLVFRADLPRGLYRVTVTLGDLSQAIGSMDVRLNDRLIGEHVAAWMPGVYRSFAKTPIGWWTHARGTVDVTDGIIRITVSKNQAYYDEQMARQAALENPYRKYWWPQAPEKDPPYFYIGYPFVHNSVMAIEIVPHVPPPVVGENDNLKLTRPVQSPALEESISLFNRGDFGASLSALARVTEKDAQVGKAIVSLWLAGRLEVEKEKALVAEAKTVLSQYVSANPSENGVSELLQDAAIFDRALSIHLGRVTLGRNHFIENDKAIGLWWLIRDHSPLYYKSQLYIARAAHMLVPYIPTLGTEAEILKKLEEKFPDNRYVRYLLHWQWENHGDGTQPTDWYMADYSAKVRGAPEWAARLYPAFAGLLDWAEWFIRHKQGPEGAVGGGLSDDVEMIGAIGYLGFIGRGVSQLAIDGARKLCEGNWRYGNIDDEIGFYLPFADAEHVAEPTGNTLDMMVTIDYGSPLWIERSTKTAKLMRDLWTGPNKKGLRHFRANFFSATRVGSGDQMNDSWINYRAVAPAQAVLWYNQNPAISRLFVELADAWLAAAMSTERGKPMGVIPAQVSFPEGTIGGTNSPNWYTASHPQGTVNYDWAEQEEQDYKDFMHSLLMTACEQTGDAKYLKPLQLEYELAAKYGRAPAEVKRGRLAKLWRYAAFGTELVYQMWPDLLSDEEQKEAAVSRAAPKPEASPEAPLEPGSERWVAYNLKGPEAWFRAKRAIEGRKGALEDDVTKEEIARHGRFVLGMLKVRWPLMTTESSATDRVGFHGIVDPFLIYTGGTVTGRYLRPSVTYDNTTRDFAAAVMSTDRQGFRVMYHSLTRDTREIGLVPWDLEAGGKYVLQYGPDSNEDGVMDSVAERREFHFVQRGTPVKVTIAPRTTYVIEVDQLERGRGPALAPDPAIWEGDIRQVDMWRGSVVLVRVHNVGSKAVQNLKVDIYDGNPEAGGTLLSSSVIYNIDPPNDLEPRAFTVGANFTPADEPREIYVVLDPEDEIKDEITSFNNVAHAKLPRSPEPAPPQKRQPAAAPPVPDRGR